VLASAPALASHASAGRLWGLLRYKPTTFDVTTATRRRPKPHLRVHHASLADPDRARCDGVPATSVARTTLDLAAIFSEDRLARALERAEELAILDLDSIDELLTRVTRHRGIASLRSALAIHRPSPVFTRSELERRFLALVHAARLPRPAMNFSLLGFELDAYWAEERIAVELDAYETHGSRLAFERDRIRDEELTLAGVATVRITGHRMEREPDQVIERVATLLETRRRRLEVRRRGGGAR
jgi:very-short-patch-repair endonuclease